MKQIKRNILNREYKHISIVATREEVNVFEQIKRHYQRKTDSDMLRFLINQEAQKILGHSAITGAN